MKEKFFKLEIITPFQIIYQDQVKHIRAPGVEGYFGILARHAPFITSLRIGEIKVDIENETKYFSTSGGIIEVLPYTTTILVETAEEAGTIDVQRALSAKQRAERRLSEKAHDTNLKRAKIAFMKAKNRLKISQKNMPS